MSNYNIKILSKKMNFKEAMKACDKEGGQLMRIDSKDDQKRVEGAIKQKQPRLSGRDHWWIGFWQPQGAKTPYVWTDGCPAEYTQWNRGEPNFAHEQCVLVGWARSLNWFDHSCGWKSYPVCQIPAGKKPPANKIPPASGDRPQLTEANLCAKEWDKNDKCFCKGTVYYGTIKSIMAMNPPKFSKKQSDTYLRCNNPTFKDPLYGIVKSCYCDGKVPTASECKSKGLGFN